MAIKVIKLKEIALEDDYTHPVVSSGTGPISFRQWTVMAFLL